MLKLTRKLFALQPDVRYAEFHERALFNHILGSMDASDGATCYMVPVGSGVRREYADMHRSFTCCVGTGMESHALHGLGLYYEAGDQAVGQPLRAVDGAVGSRGRQARRWTTTFPEGDAATLTLDVAGAEGVHARAAPAVVGRRRLRGARQRQADRACASQPGSYVDDHAHLEDRRHRLADAAEDAAARSAARQPEDAPR